jgi:hypothetical protein
VKLARLFGSLLLGIALFVATVATMKHFESPIRAWVFGKQYLIIDGRSYLVSGGFYVTSESMLFDRSEQGVATVWITGDSFKTIQGICRATNQCRDPRVSKYSDATSTIMCFLRNADGDGRKAISAACTHSPSRWSFEYVGSEGALPIFASEILRLAPKG